MALFFLGSLVGLPTLNSILVKFGIRSNLHQLKYNELCKNLNEHTLRKLFEYVFEQNIIEELTNRIEKDSSIFSRELVTVVLDDSIFRQWLQEALSSKGLDEYYGKFFSGQFKTGVYGYKVLTLGVSIDGVFHPLYFDFVKKDKTEKAVELANRLVSKWGKLISQLRAKGLKIPKIHLSCDSGYNDLRLCQTCQENQLIYISVPKKSHLIEIDGKACKISNWIENEFIQLEKQDQEDQKDLPEDEKEPFKYRFRAVYKTRGETVTFLAFRLNGSKKVSIIYTPEKNIFAKTLRRHWFQRTYIEQFFKKIKHVLKIQEPRVRNKNEFELKLWRFAFIAWHAQKIVKFIRKKSELFKQMGFIAIQRILCSDEQFLDLLQNQIQSIC